MPFGELINRYPAQFGDLLDEAQEGSNKRRRIGNKMNKY
jgi:hypothetical protein